MPGLQVIGTDYFTYLIIVRCKLANLDVVASWLADLRVGSGFFVTCRENAAMLAETDYVRRKLNMLRQRKLQEAQDMLMVF